MKKEKRGDLTIYKGKRFVYAYSKELPMLLISSIDIPLSRELRITLPVKNKEIAEQIINLLEK